MVSQNHPHGDDSWAGEFPSDVPPNLKDDPHPYNASNASLAHLHAGPTFNGDLANHHTGNFSGVGTNSSSLDEYELHFGPHSPVTPAARSPPSPPPLAFDEIVNILAFSPNEAPGPALVMPDSAEPTSDQFAPTPVQGPVPVQIPSFPQARHTPFGGPSMSVSLPYRLNSTQDLMSPDVQRSRSGSYGGPIQSPYHHSAHPSAFNLTSHTAFNGTFHIEFQDLEPGPSRITSSHAGSHQHVIQFDSDSHQYEDSSVPPTIQPSSIPLPTSPADDSSFESSPTLSPATSTSSLANPPSPTAVRNETFKWRLNSQESQGWRCDCNTKAKKKKRHLESCPRNPSKPTIKCPCCPQIFVGGSRKSALKKHMVHFHKDKLHLLKKYKG